MLTPVEQTLALHAKNPGPMLWHPKLGLSAAAKVAVKRGIRFIGRPGIIEAQPAGDPQILKAAIADVEEWRTASKAAVKQVLRAAKNARKANPLSEREREVLKDTVYFGPTLGWGLEVKPQHL